MRLTIGLALVFLVAPATASAAVTMTTREVPLHGNQRRLAASGPQTFDLVGLHWQGPGSVEFRTRSVAGRWSAWHRAAPEAEDRPDASSTEARARRRWRIGNPYWTGPSNRIEYRLHGR